MAKRCTSPADTAVTKPAQRVSSQSNASRSLAVVRNTATFDVILDADREDRGFDLAHLCFRRDGTPASLPPNSNLQNSKSLLWYCQLMGVFFCNPVIREYQFRPQGAKKKGERMTITRRVAFARIAASTLIGYFGGGFAARASGSVTYIYDALGRVISATYATGQTITYAYDDAGNRKLMAQGSGGGSGFNQTIPVSGTAPVNLRTLANDAGYNGAENATIVFQVNSGVTITGAAGATGGIAIDTGTWPSGYTTILSLHVTNGGAVRGGGGGGGAGGGSSQTGSPGDTVGMHYIAVCRWPSLSTPVAIFRRAAVVVVVAH